jgi:predicted permease
MRPIRPEPSEYPKIKKAYRAAKLMKWWTFILMVLMAILSGIVGHHTFWYIGLSMVLILWSVFLFVGYSKARCPHCGQIWWSSRTTLMFVVPIWLLFMGEDNDETESFVCRRCRLDIGYGLR